MNPTDFKIYNKRPSVEEKEPVCNCSHMWFFHKGLDIPNMSLKDQYEWNKTNRGKCENCLCPKYKFKTTMTHLENIDLISTLQNNSNVKGMRND